MISMKSIIVESLRLLNLCKERLGPKSHEKNCEAFTSNSWSMCDCGVSELIGDINNHVSALNTCIGLKTIQIKENEL